MDEKLKDFYEQICSCENKEPWKIFWRVKNLLVNKKIISEHMGLRKQGTIISIRDNTEATHLERGMIEISFRTKTLIEYIYMKQDKMAFQTKSNDILKITSAGTGWQTVLEINLS